MHLNNLNAPVLNVLTELTCKLPLLQECKGPQSESPYHQNLHPFASLGKQLGYSESQALLLLLSATHICAINFMVKVPPSVV